MNNLIDNFKGYNGNIKIKRGGIPVNWTPELAQEFMKCAQDPVYFAEKYVQIVHVDHGLVPISLYDYQNEILQKITNNRRAVAVTSRQAGKTTTAVVVILHYILFNEDKTVALLSNKGDSAREILNRIKIAYEALPKWLQQGVQEWNKGSVEFENGCKIIAAATSSSAIRGRSISFLYIDEAAFVENWDEFFASVYPTISSGVTTKILLTSTPNGLNHFYKTCVGAQQKGDDWNGFEFVNVSWERVPGRDTAWKKEMLASMDWDYQKFAQEFECEFLGSSGTLIDGATLKRLVAKRPISDKNNIFVYEEPQEGHTYVGIVDVSRGKGLDYSVLQIIDVTKMPYNQVCVYRDNVTPPVEFTEIIHRVCSHYKDAVTLVEINDIGGQVSDMLYHEYEYENVLFTESAGRIGRRLSSGFGSGVEKGIRTTKQVKSVGCSILKLLVEQTQLIINDYNTISELSTFSRKGISYEAEPGCHDDLVMCLVLFAWMSDQRYFKELTDINTLAKLRQKTEEELFEEVPLFGHISNGVDDIDDDERDKTLQYTSSWRKWDGFNSYLSEW